MFTVIAAHPSQKIGPTGETTAPTYIKVNGQQYVKGSLLGSGAFGQVFRARDATGKVFACKIMDKSKVSSKNHQKMRSEIKIQAKLQHRHIVRLFNHMEDTTHVYLVMELCPNATMADMLRKRKTLLEPEIRLYVGQITSAIKYMHDNDCVHRDLKPGNILLDANMDVKICDLGLAAVVSAGHQRRTFCGTPNFISPEVLDKNGHGFEVDIWAIGVIMYTLVVGTPPFQSKDKDETIKLIQNPDFKYHVPDNVNQATRDVFDGLLQRNPAKRPSASKILNFTFFVNGMVPSRVPVEALTKTPVYDDLLVPFARMPMRETTNLNTNLNTLPEGKPSLNKAAAARAVRQKRLLSQPMYAPSHDKENQVYTSVHKPARRVLKAMPLSNNQPEQATSSYPMGRSGGVLTRVDENMQSKAPLQSTRRQIPVAVPRPTSFGQPLATASSMYPTMSENVRQESKQASRPMATTAPMTTNAPMPPKPAPVTEPEGGKAAEQEDRVFERKNYQKVDSQLPPELYRAIEHNWEEASAIMLEKAKHMLDVTVTQRSDTLNPAKPVSLQDPPALLWVSRWLDYSYKYGLSYQLSDGTVGVHFIDNTQIVLSPQRDVVEYSDDKQQILLGVEDPPPQMIAKKIRLLDHFRAYMTDNLLMGGVGIPAVDSANRKKNSDFVRVYEWVRSETAIVFQLTNGVIQLNFFDHAKVMISMITNLVTFIPVQAACQTYRLCDITKENYPELHGRLRHLKAHLAHLMERKENQNTTA